ncbi:MAG: methionyl-tRNA formyltransferase [Acidobacteriota bacterium]
MAIVRKLERITLEHGSGHTEVNCTYSIIQGDDGKSLQVDTYGSAHRKMPDKKSQSIRFSPEAIAQLREILSKEL